MLGAFTDEGVIGANSTSEEHIDPNNGTLDDGIDQAWETTKLMGSNVINEITRLVGFGSIAYCVKRPDGKAIHHFNDVNTKIWSDSKASAGATHEATKNTSGEDLDAEKPAAAIDEFQDTNKANEIDEPDYEPTEKEDKSNHKEDKSKIEKAIGSVKRRLSKTWEAVFSDDESKKGKQAPPSNDDDIVNSDDDEKKFVTKGVLSNVRDLDIDDLESANKHDDVDDKDDHSNHKEDKSMIEKAIGSVKRRLSKTWEAVFSDDESKKGKQAPPSNDDDIDNSGDDEKKFVAKGELSNVRDLDIDDLESANKHDDVDDKDDHSNHKEDKSMIEKAIGSVKRRLSKTWEAVFSDDETKKEKEVLSNDDIVDRDADDKEFVMKGAKDTAIAEYEGGNIPRTLIWDY